MRGGQMVGVEWKENVGQCRKEKEEGSRMDRGKNMRDIEEKKNDGKNVEKQGRWVGEKHKGKGKKVCNKLDQTMWTHNANANSDFS